MIWALLAACVVAAVPAGLRWLRVAQREHYLPPATSRFAMRWWASSAANLGLVVVATVGVVGSFFDVRYGFLAVASEIAGPFGLSVRGVSSPLAWTARMRRLAAVSGALLVVLFLAGAAADSAWLVALGVVSIPVIVDFALLILQPVESAIGDKWVARATSRLRSSEAKVVAITGSYGKTTTKQYAAHILSGAFRTVASPASFNNRMGLARAANEHLTPGTEVFIAEMGTYGPGEIAALCDWVKPDVSAIVAIGPVHLERFKTEERIVAAKAEVLNGATVGVIGIDHPLLVELARARAGSLELVTVSTEGRDATIAISEGQIHLEGRSIGLLPDWAFALNLGVAIGIATALGMSAEQVASRLGGLPRPEHRQTLSQSDKGFTIIDDTYNSNPAGARQGLKTLTGLGDGRKALVTPGMVELGPQQNAENRAFAATAAAVVDDIIVVGRTNRSTLLEGSEGGNASVTVVASREEAVDWVRDNLGPGDAVLYENDLPDHYP